jgi:membrane protease YdiL (CAAX protease family)
LTRSNRETPHLRYYRLALFILFLGVTASAVEGVLRFSDSSYSLTDSRGPGQWSFLAFILAAVLLFSWVVARVDPLQFIVRYFTRWRTLKGFLLMFVSTMLLAALGYLALAALGYVHWSQAAWENLRSDIVEKISVALLIVLLLATVEESIFRAVVLRYLRSDDSFWVTVGAVVVSSAIFSVSHIIALSDVWYLMTDKVALLTGLFIIGLLLGTTYVVTGSLACSIGVHCGLLGFKVILIRTHVVSVVPDGLVADDIRSAPLAWLVFLLAILALILWRHRLREAFSVETAVCPDGDGEFKLPARSPARDAPLGAPP